MIYARSEPRALTADQLQRITAVHGATMPRGDVVALNSLDTLTALCDDLGGEGVSFTVIEDSEALPEKFTEKEVHMLGCVWLAPQLGDRGG